VREVLNDVVEIPLFRPQEMEDFPGAVRIEDAPVHQAAIYW
jgi:hypothetical protein